MRYGSVCSGVEAATVAWHPLGWEPQWFSEIEKFPSAVLQHHYPTVPNFGDMTNFKEWNDDPIDLLVGGTPCQSFSVAGLRKGLDDPRGNLMLTYLAIAERYQPRWLVWENVPGVLSSNGGRDFGTFLTALGQLGYGFAYRVLDAQYFGVAQRRRRVFVVGHLGDWRRAAAVLFERESLSGYPAPSRPSREEVAEVAGPLTAGMHKGPRGTEAVESNHIIAFPSEMSGTQVAMSREISPALSVSHTMAMAFDPNQITSKTNASQPKPELMHTLPSKPVAPVLFSPTVRRLTPRECERLQGFPDDYTLIPYRNKLAADTPRYKAMGNSMAVPVMNWIGKQIQMVENMK